MKNLLLLGDSIRMGYDSFVREKLQGRADVYFPEDNGRFAQYTLRTFNDWWNQLGKPQLDIVHWNTGLWDILHLNACPCGADGEAQGETISPENLPEKLLFEKEMLTPPGFYRYMLDRIVTRIREFFPKADIIFATTTGVLEGQASWAYRSNDDIEAYNAIAREVLIPRGVRINELGDFANRQCLALHRDAVHFNDEGSARIADEIIAFLEKENLL